MDLQDLNPKDHGQYFIIDCPKCGHHEAFVYKAEVETAKKNPKSRIHYFCNRQNKCGAHGFLEDISVKNTKITPSKKGVGLSQEALKKIQILYQINDSIKGFDFSVRGIDNEILKKEKVLFYPFGFSELILTSGGHSDPKYQRSYFSERDLYFPVVNEKLEVVRLLLRSTKPVEKKELQIKITDKPATEIWNLKDVMDPNITTLFLCEGCYDALSIKQAAQKLGRKDIGAISIPGCRKIKKVIKELLQYPAKTKYVIATDSDEAGREALKTGVLMFRYNQLNTSIFPLHGYKDVNDFLLGNPDLFFQEVNKH